MPNRSSKQRRPRDPNQRAKLIVGIATGQAEDKDPDESKNPAAVTLGGSAEQRVAQHALRN